MNTENNILNILEETKKYIIKTINETTDISEKLKYIDKLKELEDKIKYFTTTTQNNNNDKLNNNEIYKVKSDKNMNSFSNKNFINNINNQTEYKVEQIKKK